MLVGCAVVGLLAADAFAQQIQAPEWKHGLEFRVRKADEKDFTEKTRSYGSEAFIDRNNNACLIYLTDAGSLAALPGGNFTSGAKVLAPRWLHGMAIPVRKASEVAFTKDSPRFGVELFKDENAGTLVFLSETGSLAIARAGSYAGGSSTKAPKRLHGLSLRVRRAGEADFTKDTRRFGVEVYRDENTGHLLYVSETGAIALYPSNAVAPSGAAGKEPRWMHGLEVPVRKAGEADFTPTTTRRNLEVFRDDATGALVYISETGSLAVLPAESYAGVTDTKDPKRLFGLEFKVRRAGEASFTPATRKWGTEVFRDENNGRIMYITESGSLAVVPAK
jgi:hypothetical protein